MNLTPQERRELRDLVEQLVQATEGHAFWLNQVRATILALRDRLDAWLGDENEDHDTGRGDENTGRVSHQHSAGGGGLCEE
ncbi:hypothetical protein FHX37_3187 [Haloactinospora alba]|uniref:Uncharacterized protein n=1 Tax=Haloactinospora alba TaxID=405555 RepID=A0A543NMY5_9ACTN|nr:hypothetical protein [Haloactinospora alba]TQN33186.1 hypothetical protein FHX37_3187 [Haloactinospora alba]